MSIRTNSQKAIQDACDVVSELIRIEQHVKDAKHLINTYVDDINTPKYDGIMQSLEKALIKIDRLGDKL
ncbi:gp197 [Bacillus phage W.Ph.]|uniref:Gp197 n=1 Tax=Bacillus phage W.Ph. TaxID=764595 RepID=G9B1U8_9CAUD|nr:gp197 [Bacillus phage W.Ph.]ADH03343.1 gp197 [Bacillus phage W.Ph.]